MSTADRVDFNAIVIYPVGFTLAVCVVCFIIHFLRRRP